MVVCLQCKLNCVGEIDVVRMCDLYMLCRLCVPLMWFTMNLMIMPGMFVCSSFLISVCMFIVSKALLISSDTVIVSRRGGGSFG